VPHAYPFGFGRVGAHRGASSIAPENTLLAARRAVELGAHFWETDVRLAAGDELVIFHDEALSRTTDVAARPEFSARAPWPAHAFSAAEIRSLNAGRWFLETDPKGGLAAGLVNEAGRREIAAQRPPALAEALAFTRERAFPMNLEIKDHAGLPGDARIVPLVLDSLAEAGCEDLVLLSSFRHEYLAQARALNPRVPTAALVEERHPDDLVAYLRGLGVAAYHPEHVMVDADLARRLHAAGLRLNVWTVNEPAEASALLAAGVDALISDWPQRLLPLVA